MKFYIKSIQIHRFSVAFSNQSFRSTSGSSNYSESSPEFPSQLSLCRETDRIPLNCVLLFYSIIHKMRRKKNKTNFCRSSEIVSMESGRKAKRAGKTHIVLMWNVCEAISIGKICAQKVSNLFRSDRGTATTKCRH